MGTSDRTDVFCIHVFILLLPRVSLTVGWKLPLSISLQFKVATGWSCWLSLSSLVLFLFRLCHNCVSDRSWNWRDGTTAAGGIGKCGQREKMRSAKTCLNFTRNLSPGFGQLLQELELSKSEALTKCQLGIEML